MATEYVYEKITDPMGNELIKRSDNAFIPLDEGNADYRKYLENLENESANG